MQDSRLNPTGTLQRYAHHRRQVPPDREHSSVAEGRRVALRVVAGRTDSVIIVGAGLAGLSTALRLVGAGRKVTILEREQHPGGRAGRLDIAGYRFDTGPTVLTMPELIQDALSCVGESIDDRLDLIRVDPAYRARFADGSVIDVHTDQDAMVAEIARTCGPADAEGYLRLVGFLAELFRVEMPDFIDRNLDGIADVVGPGAFRLLQMGSLRRLDPLVRRFVTDDRLRRIFSFQAMYAGLAPQEALGIYAVIAYMDCVRGVYFPRGGMHALPAALAAAAADHGVDIRYGTDVSRIEVQGGRATGVVTSDGDRLRADVVVVNADLPMAYRTLLAPEHTPRRVKHLSYSPSCALLHVGSARKYPELLHHTIDFGRAWRRTFDEIIHRGHVMSDPSLLISNPTATDPTLAPAGKQTYYALFPTPNTITGRHIDWAVEGPRYRDHMLQTLEARGLAGFGDAIEVEHLVTPADWQRQGLAAGAPFSASHKISQTGPFRQPTLSRQIDNLVFCGANTQPGVGVPMVMISGRLAAERITGIRSKPQPRHETAGARR
jgi:phytoene desaturase